MSTKLFISQNLNKSDSDEITAEGFETHDTRLPRDVEFQC